MSVRSRRAYDPGAATAAGSVLLSDEESHHLGRVLRLREGDAVSVFDGKGREWDGTLDAWEGKRARVTLGAERTDPVEPPITVRLFQGLCRPERMELMIQKCTEIGVASFHPIVTARSEGPDPSPARMERWRRVAMEACKQSGRRTLPEVHEPRDFPLEDLTPGTIAFALDFAAHARPLGVLLDGPPSAEVWIAIGPEGGFEVEEIETLTSSGWRVASLGPRVLRTETAGAVAASIVLHRWADLGAGR